MNNVKAHEMKHEDNLVMKMTMSFLATPLLLLLVAGAIIAA